MPISLEQQRTCVRRVVDPLERLKARSLPKYLVDWFRIHSMFTFWTDDAQIRIIKRAYRKGVPYDDSPLNPDLARRDRVNVSRSITTDSEENLSFQGRLDERIKGLDPKMQEAIRLHVRVDRVRPHETVKTTAKRLGLSYGYLRKTICVVKRDLDVL